MNLPAICIDAGHGGRDHGAEYGSIIEKDVNIDIALRLRSLLLSSSPSWPVSLTRKDDEYLTLRTRGVIASSLNADFVLSIHVNAAESKYLRGAQSFVWPENELSERLARSAMMLMPDQLRRHELPFVVRKDNWTKRAYNVVKSFHQPCALIELGFATNDSDASFLMSEPGRIKIAVALLRSCLELIRQ